MAEIVKVRKQLSDVQFKMLLGAAQKRTQAEAAFREASAEAERVTTLVFDALNVPLDASASVDEATQELVVDEVKDKSPRKPKLAKV